MTTLSPIEARPENLTDVVFRRIRESIVDMSLPPGSRVSEASVAAILNVSKTPVREALLRLRHVGVVEASGSGLRVVKPSVKAIQDAYEFRAGLESSSAYYAANRVDPADASRIAELARRSLVEAQARRGAGFREYDGQFHHAVAQSTHNPVIANAVADSLLLTSVLRERDVPASGDSIECAEMHVRIAEAIADGGAESAAEQMSQHVLHVMDIVLAARAARTARS